MARKPTVSQAANEYIQLKGDKKRIETRIHELEEIIEPAIREKEDDGLALHGWRFTVVEYEQESFKLKAALEKIARKVLEPFITKSQVKQIRMNWMGGEPPEKTE